MLVSHSWRGYPSGRDQQCVCLYRAFISRDKVLHDDWFNACTIINSASPFIEPVAGSLCTGQYTVLRTGVSTPDQGHLGSLCCQYDLKRQLFDKCFHRGWVFIRVIVCVLQIMWGKKTVVAYKTEGQVVCQLPVFLGNVQNYYI